MGPARLGEPGAFAVPDCGLMEPLKRRLAGCEILLQLDGATREEVMTDLLRGHGAALPGFAGSWGLVAHGRRDRTA